MTISDINQLQNDVKEAKYVVDTLEKLKLQGIYGEFADENFTADYHAFQGHGFKLGSAVGNAVLNSMKFDWNVFDIHLINARKTLVKLTKELQVVNGYLNNIRIKEEK